MTGVQFVAFHAPRHLWPHPAQLHFAEKNPLSHLLIASGAIRAVKWCPKLRLVRLVWRNQQNEHMPTAIWCGEMQAIMHR